MKFYKLQYRDNLLGSNIPLDLNSHETKYPWFEYEKYLSHVN